MANAKHYSVLLNGEEVYHGAIRTATIVYRSLESAFKIINFSDYVLTICFKI
ncbi:hypothetical protein [Dipodfec virus UA23Rod_1217]|uniref:Uncharacterized protein n=1 Tax=Dipodfec virus UA23Rod_1217 TaxID=2929329 RepID=A0A976N1E0_9VIRU|nr:hypothetical protein [Dipodfec virus UA23Rod_1217]